METIWSLLSRIWEALPSSIKILIGCILVFSLVVIPFIYWVTRSFLKILVEEEMENEPEAGKKLLGLPGPYRQKIKKTAEYLSGVIMLLYMFIGMFFVNIYLLIVNGIKFIRDFLKNMVGKMFGYGKCPQCQNTLFRNKASKPIILPSKKGKPWLCECKVCAKSYGRLYFEPGFVEEMAYSQ